MGERAGASDDGDGGGAFAAEDAVRDGAEKRAAQAARIRGSDEDEIVAAGRGFFPDSGIDVVAEDYFGRDVFVFERDACAGERVLEDLLAYFLGDVIDIRLDVEWRERAFGTVCEALSDPEGAAGIGSASGGHEDAGAGGDDVIRTESEKECVAVRRIEKPSGEVGRGRCTRAARAALFAGDEKRRLEARDFIGNRPEGVGSFRHAERHLRPVFAFDFRAFRWSRGVFAERGDGFVHRSWDFF